MPVPAVRLKIRVRLSNGSRAYVDPVYSSDGKLKPLYAVVNGKPEHHPEGVYNRNDLAVQLGEQFTQAQAYYTLSYSPTDKNWNGNFRRINLKLKDGSYKLFYRRGYYADAPPPPHPTQSMPSPSRCGTARLPQLPSSSK